MSMNAKQLLRTVKDISQRRGDHATAKEAALTLEHMSQSKPFGWEVIALFNDRLVKIESTSERKTFHYRASRSQAIMRVKLKPHFFKLVDVLPVDEASWRRAFGDPETRGL